MSTLHIYISGKARRKKIASHRRKLLISPVAEMQIEVSRSTTWSDNLKELSLSVAYGTLRVIELL